MVGLLVVGLLAVAAPAMAQQMDPLGLIGSGAVIPFIGNGTIAPGSQSFIEVYSPVRGNGNLHMFFFDQSCTRGPVSVGLPQSADDVDVIQIDNLEPTNPVQGLITLAGVAGGGFDLIPLTSPVHVRVLWVNASQDYIRVLEPIGIDNAEFPATKFLGLTTTGTLNNQLGEWNPLRSAATFFAPLEAPASNVTGVHTTVYFVCPNSNIAGGGSSAFPETFTSSGARAGLRQFPALRPLLASGSGGSNLRARIFNDEEGFLRDIRFTCNCLTATAVTSLSSVYSSTGEAPRGTYTEVEGQSTSTTTNFCNTQTIPSIPDTRCPGGGTFINSTTQTVGPTPFTGYRAIRASNLDVFGRLSNGNVGSVQGAGESPTLPAQSRVNHILTDGGLFSPKLDDSATSLGQKR
jgi:hypothetical protein